LGLQIRTIERWEYIPEDRRQGPLNKPSNALSEKERDEVIKIANSPEFCNLPPSQIVPKLADQGKYIASESTFYRILKEKQLLAHRSKSNPRSHAKPQELVATGPNMIWSWDISYLKAAIKGVYYYLYLPMDIYSRKIVHWEIHERETAENAANMIGNACLINGIKDGEISLHSDNGSPMKGATMLATLQSLGIMPSFSRPKVSNDNPFSESLFKTLKYCPSFPERGFLGIDEARAWVEKFVDWYNNIHLHSGIKFVTPASRHKGLDKQVLSNRKAVYEKARSSSPARWSKNTRNWQRPEIVELNPGRMTKEHKHRKAA
jgi:transposase InsO family protein